MSSPTPPSQTIGPVLRKALTRSQLLAAWEKVRANQGCAGVDGVTVQAFATGVQARLDGLRSAVLGGRYVAQPLLRLWLPRPEGKAPRGLAVPCVVDRVLQTALAMVLQPLFEAEFEDCSFAYRQGRSVRQAVERIGVLQRQGYRWVVDGDIEAFFDQIPHGRLLAELLDVVGDASVVALVAHWLAAPIESGGVAEPVSALGVAQGSPLSPMLANLYLDHLDEALLHKDLALVRYADDFVILTRIVYLDAGFDFLGWTFVRSLAVPRQRGAEPEPVCALLRLPTRVCERLWRALARQRVRLLVNPTTTGPTTGQNGAADPPGRRQRALHPPVYPRPPRAATATTRRTAQTRCQTPRAWIV